MQSTILRYPLVVGILSVVSSFRSVSSPPLCRRAPAQSMCLFLSLRLLSWSSFRRVVARCDPGYLHPSYYPRKLAQFPHAVSLRDRQPVAAAHGQWVCWMRVRRARSGSCSLVRARASLLLPPSLSLSLSFSLSSSPSLFPSLGR